jgi:hypothetical protein
MILQEHYRSHIKRGMKVIMNGEWVRNLEGHVNSIPVHGIMNNLTDCV